MKISHVVIAAILVTIFMAPAAFAQNAASQVSTGNLTLIGTASLSAPGTISRTLGESSRRPTHDVDLPAVRPSSGGLKTPTPPVSSVIERVAGLGFSGLTHDDQWNAGTGIYANTQFSTEPPDQGLAVGNGFVLEAVNTALAVYSKNGKLLAGPTPLNQFFNRVPDGFVGANGIGDFLTDPDCYFDQQTQRWFVTAAQIDFNPNTNIFGPRGRILIAVSKSADPTGDFNLFSIDATDDGTLGTQSHRDCPCFPDQPHVGADKNGFYIGTNEFNIAGLNGAQSVLTGAQIYAISKKRLINGDKLPPFVHLVPFLAPPDIAYAVLPARQLPLQETSDGGPNDSAGGIEYFLSTLNVLKELDNRIAVWAISNTASLSSSKPDIDLTKAIVTSEVYGPPPSASQKPGPTPLRDYLTSPQNDGSYCSVVSKKPPLEKLHTNNDRMHQVVFAGGKLWAGLNTVVEQNRKQQRAGIAFFSVMPSLSGGILKAQIVQQGYLSVSGNDVLNPAIAVDKGRNPAMVFTLAGPDFFPSAAFVKIAGEEDQFGVHVAAPGVAPEDGFTGYDACAGTVTDGIARWGDYSSATTDENGNVWIATEFIPTKSSGVPGTGTFLAHWGTFVARVPGNDNP